MLGWIIYTKTDAKKNEWFISKFQKYATKNGTDLELIYVEDLTRSESTRLNSSH